MGKEILRKAARVCTFFLSLDSLSLALILVTQICVAILDRPGGILFKLLSLVNG